MKLCERKLQKLPLPNPIKTGMSSFGNWINSRFGPADRLVHDGSHSSMMLVMTWEASLGSPRIAPYSSNASKAGILVSEKTLQSNNSSVSSLSSSKSMLWMRKGNKSILGERRNHLSKEGSGASLESLGLPESLGSPKSVASRTVSIHKRRLPDYWW
jgi:hypothetical protein